MFAEKVIQFLKQLEYTGSLPAGISIMNPFRDNPDVIPIITRFYTKFYNDLNPRHIIMGINPGRFGAGVTGIPFTDSKRLSEKCGISFPGVNTHETSSVFIYEMIDAFGGAERFYSKFFISAVSPLGYTAINEKGRSVNYNYYDNPKLADAVMDFIIKSIMEQLEFGIERDICFCLGTGKNFKFLVELNDEHKIFGKIVPLEHPRFIMQYRTKKKNFYIKKYLEELQLVLKS